MAQTGEVCQVAGIYKCSTHPSHQITMPKGHKFPPCDAGGKGHSAHWILVKATHH
jgi:hypothetical protein